VARSVLIVDDEEGIRQSLASILSEEGYTTDSVSSGEDCLEAARRRPYDLVLLDIWLNGMDGLETLS
jgi:two-component system, NtrC family, nitrogen regulation response regulator NtrX